jgi:glycosyltransferase involved in cell wall biosynthesis
VHFCQGYEGLWQGARHRLAEIEEVYRLPTMKLVVSPHLAELIAERTGQPAIWIPQPFEPELFSPPQHERPLGPRLRVLLSGLWNLDIKGVEWGMRALRPLAEEGWLELVRLSQELDEEEVAFWPDAERHARMPSERVPDLMRGVDVFLSLCDEVEGFGLPALEAMGCARASVVTDIAPMRALDPEKRAALRIPVGDAEALRAALRQLRGDIGLRRRLGRAGREIASTFTEERTGRALIAAFESALRERRYPSLSR